MLRLIPAIFLAVMTGVLASAIVPPIKVQPSPYVHSTLKAKDVKAVLWAFRTDRPNCPAYYMLQIEESHSSRLLARHIQSCSGIVNMAYDGSVLTLAVPSEDASSKTFFYVYCLRIKDYTWLDLGH